MRMYPKWVFVCFSITILHALLTSSIRTPSISSPFVWFALLYLVVSIGIKFPRWKLITLTYKHHSVINIKLFIEWSYICSMFVVCLVWSDFACASCPKWTLSSVRYTKWNVPICVYKWDQNHTVCSNDGRFACRLPFPEQYPAPPPRTLIISRLIALWSHAFTVIILVISPGPLLHLSTENC